MPLAEVDSLFLSEPAPMDSQGVAVAGLDGTRLTGALLGIDNAQFQVQAAAISTPWHTTATDLPVSQQCRVIRIKSWFYRRYSAARPPLRFDTQFAAGPHSIP